MEVHFSGVKQAELLSSRPDGLLAFTGLNSRVFVFLG
jgi:hypothetical protein